MATTRLFDVQLVGDTTRLWFRTYVEPMPTVTCYEVPTSQARALVDDWEIDDRPPIEITELRGDVLEFTLLDEVTERQALADCFLLFHAELSAGLARGKEEDPQLMGRLLWASQRLAQFERFH